MSVKLHYTDVPGVRLVVVEATWPSRANPYTLKSISDGTPTNYGEPDGTAVTYAIIDAIRDKLFRGPKADLVKNTIIEFAYNCDEKHTWLSITCQPAVSTVGMVIKIIAECVCPSARLAKADAIVRTLGVKADREAAAAEADHIHSALKSGGLHILVIGKVTPLKATHREKIESDAERKFKDGMSAPEGPKKARKVENPVPLPERPFLVKTRGVSSYLTKKLLEDKTHVRCFIVGDDLYSFARTGVEKVSEDGVKSFASGIARRLKDDAALLIAYHCASKGYFPPSDIREFASQKLTEASIASAAKKG